MSDESDSKSLAFLLSGITMVDPDFDVDIHGLSVDSRQVKPGDLFIAYPGEKVDGRDFIEQAIKLGAAAVLAEEAEDGLVCDQDHGVQPQKRPSMASTLPPSESRRSSDEPHDLAHILAQAQSQLPLPIILTAKNIQHKVGQIAARFYGHPSRQMHVTGITGTNGKTSIAYLLSYAFNQLSVHKAYKNTSVYFGTLGTGFSDALEETSHTTLDPIHLQAHLAKYLNQHVTHATLEVSSHALDQGRVAQIEFDTAVFTNLTRDHLDYHKTMEAYGEAKAKLFKQFGLKSAVINLDDTFGLKLYESLQDTISHSIFTIGYSLNNPKADIYADNVLFCFEGIQANIKTPWGEGILKTPLIGRFNLYNILAVVGVLGLSYPLEQVLASVEQLPHVPGRMECLSAPNKPLLIVDYAHTPDALKNVLLTAKDLTYETKGKLWCVFGCGGDRDKGKRPQMAKIAEELADYCVITNDNPRTEKPEAIVEDILTGISKKIQDIHLLDTYSQDTHLMIQDTHVILEREKAITYAFEHAKPDDVILIAGKGHECYQIIGTEKHFFSDVEVSQKLLG